MQRIMQTLGFRWQHSSTIYIILQSEGKKITILNTETNKDPAVRVPEKIVSGSNQHSIIFILINRN